MKRRTPIKKKPAPKKSIWFKLLWLMNFLLILAILIVIVAGLGLFYYSVPLSSKIEKRFSARRWQIPSVIYSDITILYPGLKVNKALFKTKLGNLGYRNVDTSPNEKGEINFSPSVVDIFLHDLSIPALKRDGFPVRIRFSGDEIAAIENPEKGEPIPLLELEPEKLMLFFGLEREQRELVSIDEIPEHLIHAVIAAEDTRFYQHLGIDPVGILRAMVANLMHGSIVQGGSTLSQQLAKNYFLTPERTYTRKLKEMLIALILDRLYEKKEILEIYLNEIYFGQMGSVSVNGIGEASRFYFGKRVEQLTVAESATIAGLIKAPNKYSPYSNKEACLSRRNTVLRIMEQNGWLSEKELKDAQDTPLTPVGFRAYKKKAPYFVDYVSNQLAELYPRDVLSGHGLSVYTTLDTQVQEAAEQALTHGIARLEKSHPALKRKEPDKRLQGALIVMQPKTGHILAMVGGRDYGASQFNRITQSLRQPGSAFKPFVYLESLDQFTPATILSNAPRSFIINGQEWVPQNYKPVTEFQVTMRSALAHSYNLATLDLALMVGMDRIAESLKKFNFSKSFEPYPSLALGASEVKPIELARAYCVFACDGNEPYPLSLKDVMDENGKILERRHMNIEQVTSPEKAYIIDDLLRSVVTEGTARSLLSRGITWPVAGKTGTTNDYRDAWFIGYTPDILALIWVGFDNGDSISASGSEASVPIWADLMNAIPGYVSKEWFKIPAGVVKYKICPASGQLAIPGRCPAPMEEIFLEQNAPTEECLIHTSLFKSFTEEVKNLFKSD